MSTIDPGVPIDPRGHADRPRLGPGTAVSDREGALVDAVLRRAAREVAVTERAALDDAPDGIHQQRVRVRRLRSILAGFRRAMDADRAEDVRAAYAAWGRDLGVVRDIEVRATFAEDLLARAGVTDPEVAERLVGRERAAYARAHARLVAQAAGPEADTRRTLLDDLLAEPGIVRPEASAAALVRRVLRTQRRRVTAAGAQLDGTVERYHALRKAARRMRYVAEAVADAAPGLFPDDVAALAGIGDTLHDALGGHRDSLLFAAHADRERTVAMRRGQDAEPYSRIETLAHADAADHLAAVAPALRRLADEAAHLG